MEWSGVCSSLIVMATCLPTSTSTVCAVFTGDGDCCTGASDSLGMGRGLQKFEFFFSARIFFFFHKHPVTFFFPFLSNTFHHNLHTWLKRIHFIHSLDILPRDWKQGLTAPPVDQRIQTEVRFTFQYFHVNVTIVIMFPHHLEHTFYNSFSCVLLSDVLFCFVFFMLFPGCARAPRQRVQRLPPDARPADGAVREGLRQALPGAGGGHTSGSHGQAHSRKGQERHRKDCFLHHTSTRED